MRPRIPGSPSRDATADPGHPRWSASSARLTRRRVTASVAWTLPVLAVAAAAPALATSGCPDLAVAEVPLSASADRISATNLAGSVSIPAGATITWLLENETATARTVTVSSLNGVGTATISQALAANGTVTFTFTTTATIAGGASVSWAYAIGATDVAAWNLRSQIRIAFSGTLAACPAETFCTSVSGTVVGTACPAATLPVAPARALPAPAVPGQQAPSADEGTPRQVP